ncbi:hypothetical protein ACVFYP_21530 [Roseomonas sp. F4]
MSDPRIAVAELEQAYTGAQVLACLRQPLASQTECRDTITQALLVAIDLRYAQFELDFFDQGRGVGFASTVASLGLGTAGALVGNGTSQILSAISAGVTGTREAFNRELLAEQTASALLTAMRGQRNLVALRIREGLSRPPAQYPLGVALSDLYSYFRAGTLPGALSGLTQLAGVQAQGAQEELRNPIPIARTPAALFLQRLLDEGTPEAQRANETEIRRQMRILGVPDTITVNRFVSTTPDEASRTRQDAVARTLNWRP